VVVPAHREVALYKIAKGGIKVKSMRLAVTEKLVVDGEPQGPLNAATLSNILEIMGDRVGEPVEDKGVHSSPRRIIGEGIIELDVVD
jgi:hypothetical protein